MSVLIKSLDKPDHCLRCPVKGIDDECLLQSEAANADYESWEDQMTNCPLIPVPPHGRLIDADAFIKRISELVRKAETDGFDLGAVWYTAFIRHIELVPTIIPAEEGE